MGLGIMASAVLPRKVLHHGCVDDSRSFNVKIKMIPAATGGYGARLSLGFENLPLGTSSFSAGSPVTNGVFRGLCILDITCLLLPVSYPEIVCVK